MFSKVAVKAGAKVAQYMIDKLECTIVNISSMTAFTPLTKIPDYRWTYH